MSKQWQVYAHHVIDAIEKIARIQARGDLAKDEVLYDATLRNLQTMEEATQRLPEHLKAQYPHIYWNEISGFVIFLSTIIWAILILLQSI